MGLEKVHQIAVGSADQIFALAAPKSQENFTIYKLLTPHKWIPLPIKGGTSISVGPNGTIYLTDAKNHIYQSNTFNSTWDNQRQICKANEMVENCGRWKLCREKAEIKFDVSRDNLTIALERLKESEEREI